MEHVEGHGCVYSQQIIKSLCDALLIYFSVRLSPHVKPSWVEFRIDKWSCDFEVPLRFEGLNNIGS